MTAGGDFALLAASSLPSLRGEASWQQQQKQQQQQQQQYPFTANNNSSSNNSNNGTVGSVPNLDVSRLHHLSSSLSLATNGRTPGSTRLVSDGRAQPPLPASLNDLIRRHDQDLVQSLLVDARRTRLRASEERRSKALREDWENEKETFVKEFLGNSRLGGAARIPSSSGVLSVPMTTSSSIVANTTVSTDKSDIQAVAEAHIQVLQRWNSNASYPAMNEFLRIATKTPAYADALRMARVLPSNESHQTNAAAILDRALATLQHLATQYQSLVIDRVQSATLTGHVFGETPYHGMAKTVSIFVRLQVGSTQSFWPVVYYCEYE